VKVTATLSETYIPKFNGNRELPETEQIAVEVNWPSAAELEKLKGYRISPKDEDVKVVFDTETILRRHIGKIENLDTVLNGNAHTIKSGENLADTKVLALRPLIDELKALVTGSDGLEDEEEKN
jgi:hypothetical protein